MVMVSRSSHHHVSQIIMSTTFPISRERAGCEFAGETEVHESLCFHGGSWDPYRTGFGMTRPNIKRGFKR